MFVDVRPKLVHGPFCGIIVFHSGPTLADAVQMMIEFGRHRPNESVRVRASAAELGQICPQFEPSSTGVGPMSGNLDPVWANFGAGVGTTWANIGPNSEKLPRAPTTLPPVKVTLPRLRK